MWQWLHSMHTAERWAFGVGAVGLLGVALGALADVPTAARALLIAWVLWLGISSGSAALLLMQRLTGGAWMEPLRGPMAAAVSALPLLTVLFVPLALASGALYPWAANAPAGVHTGEVAFAIRAFAILLPWSAATVWWGRRRSLGAITAAVWLIVYSVTMSLAMTEWIAARQPQWASTVFGMIVIVDQMLAGLAFGVVCVTFGPAIGRDDTTRLTKPLRRDVANVLLALVMMSAYLQFVQFLIIWAEDLPAETSWYLARTGGAWQSLALVMVSLQFVLPFGVLLFRRLKDDAAVLFAVAATLLLAGWVETVWWIGPSAALADVFDWKDAFAPVGVGGLWLWWVSRAFRVSAATPGNGYPNELHEARDHGGRPRER